MDGHGCMAASKGDQTEAAAIRDLREMEKVGSTDEIAVAWQQIDRDWPGHPERYLVDKGRSNQFLVGPDKIQWWVEESLKPAPDARSVRILATQRCSRIS